MLEKIAEFDRELFLIINGAHRPWLDGFMFYISQTIISLPLFLVLFVLIYKQYKYYSWIIVIGIALTILLSDQITSSLMKPFFMRLRPSHEPLLDGMVHTVKGYLGGKFGFASSHAANTFGIAMFMFLLLRKSTKYIVLLFIWAALVTYSRIYLGVHYPGDVVIGALVGMICATGSFYFTKWFLAWFDQHKNRKQTSV